MRNIFKGCILFNQPLNNWNVSNVVSANNMFKNCVSFRQDLSTWRFDNLIINVPNNQSNENIIYQNILLDILGNRGLILYLFNINGYPQFPQIFIEQNQNLNQHQRRLQQIQQLQQLRERLSRLEQRERQIQERINQHQPQQIHQQENQQQPQQQRINQIQFEQHAPNQQQTLEFTNLEEENRQHFGENTYEITEMNQGQAFHVHNIFNTLSERKLRFLYNAVKSEVNNPPEHYTSSNINQHIKNKFLEFINSDEFELDKNTYTEASNIIISRLNIPENLIPLYGYVIDFIFNQPYIFKKNYIESCFKDCIGGYSNADLPLTLPFNTSNLSCSKGMREKIILAFETALVTTCTIDDNTICPQKYKDILENVFKPLNIIELIQEWSENYLNNEEFKQRHNIREHDESSKVKMKKSLENFLKKKYFDAGELTQQNIDRINTEINQYEEMGVFDNLYFGGRKRKTNKRRTNGRKRKTNKRRTNGRKRTNRRKRTNKKRTNERKRTN